MACSDCSECNKRYKCSQPEHYDCPFNQVKENIQYLDILNTIKIKLTECLSLIDENKKDAYDLEDYESKIKAILEEIKEGTSEEIIYEYKRLFEEI